MSVRAGTSAACACSACAREISPPSAATALLSDMFCGLNGATLRPRRASARQSPATTVLLPAPEQVMARLLRIEYLLGRIRDVKDGPRTIDLDLLLYGNHKSDTEFLRLPHPCLHQRLFVLTPLAEIAPHAMHPTLRRTAAELLESSADKAAVKRWEP